MSNNGHPGLINYLDDLIQCDLPSKIDHSYEFLLHLLQQSGLPISAKKLVPPTTAAVCLGILVDTVARIISVPSEKLQKIVQMCHHWTYKCYCTKQELQSLLGMLLYITKCIKPARYFLNRMLQLLKNNHNNTFIQLNSEFASDLDWFNTFLCDYNGVTFYDNKPGFAVIELDACLVGFGGVYDTMVYHLPIPMGFQKYNIAQLELLNILVALKVWASYWVDKKIFIKCDNMAAVEVIQMG